MLKIKVDKGSEISFKCPFALKVKEKKAATIYLMILSGGFSVISLGPISLCSSPTPTLHLTKCGSRHVVFYLLLRQLNPSKSNQRFFTLCWGV